MQKTERKLFLGKRHVVTLPSFSEVVSRFVRLNARSAEPPEKMRLFKRAKALGRSFPAPKVHARRKEAL